MKYQKRINKDGDPEDSNLTMFDVKETFDIE